MDGVNWDFFLNKRVSRPNGGSIEYILRNWAEDYDLLERHHGYIQWLFPLYRGRGMNSLAFRLTRREAARMRRSVECGQRLIRSYEMMLNFWGFRLADRRTGRVERARSPRWRAGFDNLARRRHNWLRITRVFICLGHLGFARYQGPLLAALERESMQGKAGKPPPLAPLASTVRTRWARLLSLKPREYERCTRQPVSGKASDGNSSDDGDDNSDDGGAGSGALAAVLRWLDDERSLPSLDSSSGWPGSVESDSTRSCSYSCSKSCSSSSR